MYKYYDLLYDVNEYNIEEYVNQYDQEGIIELSKTILKNLPNSYNHRILYLIQYSLCDKDTYPHHLKQIIRSSCNPFEGKWSDTTLSFARNTCIDYLNNHIELQSYIIDTNEQKEIVNYEHNIINSFLKLLHNMNSLIRITGNQWYIRAGLYDKLSSVIKDNKFYNSRKFKYDYLKIFPEKT